jgi:hypothetical protein
MPRYRYIDPDTNADVTDLVPSPTATPGGLSGPITKIPGKTILGATTPPDPDPAREAYYRSHPNFAAWNRPFTNVVRGALFGAGSEEPSNWLTDIYSPKDWSQTALIPLFAMQAVGEAKLLGELAENYPALRPVAKAARAVGANWWRRMGSSALTGYASSKAAGDPGSQGTAEALTASTIGEALGLVRPIARMFGKESYLEGVNRDISHTIEKHLPIDVDPEDVADITYGHDIVNETKERVRPVYDDVHQRTAGQKVTMPHIKGGSDVRNPVPKLMKLKKAEKQFTKLGDFGYAESGSGKRNMLARMAREHYAYYKDLITAQLDARFPGQNLGQLWRGTRDAISGAEAYARLFKENVIDESTGRFDPAKWNRAVRKHWDDLVLHLGRKGAEEVRASGGYVRGMTPQMAERPDIHLRGGLPPHVGGGAGRTLRPPNVPANILYYPPRGAFSILPGIPATNVIKQAVAPTPPPVPTTPPPP